MHRKILLPFFLPSLTWALYQGSPTLPEMPEEGLFLGQEQPLSITGSYEIDAVLGRNITSDALSNTNMHSLFQGGEIALGWIDRFQLYTLLGGFSETVTGNRGDHAYKVRVGNSFGGAVGARAIAIFWGDVKVGFDAKYFYGWPRLQSITIDGQKNFPADSSHETQWQVGMGISQTFAVFTPYVGIHYARFSLQFTQLTDTSFTELIIENSSPWGIVVGLGINGTKGVFVNCEARFADEYAFAGSIGIKF